ncbi:hypothetical protein [Anabaena sp. PCC 7108]|uniref:hypothetical protein n=1 Tax=Anabaena sp. PCC 7108 TaxID=163908 RepID=UPI00034C2048|nr:hypothetical protein [Anabaena sp. PCC 7108]
MTMKPFLDDLKKKGNAAIVIAKSMGELLAQEIQSSSNNKSINYADLSKKIHKLAEQANIPHRTKTLVKDAGIDIIHDLRYGQQFDNDTLPEKVIERYMQKAYVSEFEGKIPLIPDHHAKVDNFILADRMEELKRDIFEQISRLAKKANLDESVSHLRRSRRSQIKEIDLEENLAI